MPSLLIITFGIVVSVWYWQFVRVGYQSCVGKHLIQTVMPNNEYNWILFLRRIDVDKIIDSLFVKLHGFMFRFNSKLIVKSCNNSAYIQTYICIFFYMAYLHRCTKHLRLDEQRSQAMKYSPNADLGLTQRTWLWERTFFGRRCKNLKVVY